MKTEQEEKTAAKSVTTKGKSVDGSHGHGPVQYSPATAIARSIPEFNVPDWEGTSSPGGKHTSRVGHPGVPNSHRSGLDEERNVGSS